ncbi:MAG: AAA family ATPase [Planctomyces sp.]|nr:AAA family ATPase [Planctomyces sp.]
MKLTEIDIDRFRIWRNLLLRLNPAGLNVIYGPNEAGKTTLMRFVRSVLYGFDPLAEEPAWQRPDEEQPWRGAIRCEHAGRTWRIHRQAELSGRGRLRLSGGPEGVELDEALDQLLCGTSENLYTDIFAVGVRELQQLATLGTDQVSEYIYGLSMGPQGRQILDALSDVRDRRLRMLSESGDAGQLHDLFEKYSRLSGNRRNPGRTRDQHARLTRRRRELNDEIHELQERESQITGELRGLRFIQSCYKPWKRTRDLHEEINRLPLVHTNPSEALKQLTACDRDIQEATSRREKLNEQATQFRAQADRLQVDNAFDKERYAIQSLVDQADWLRQIDEQIRQAEDRSAELRRELNHQMAQMGSGWSTDRLNAVDTSPSAHHRLLESARRYQSAIQRRGKLRRWNRGLSHRSQQELVELNTELDTLGTSIEDAIAREQHRMQELENLGRLRLQEERLALKIQTVRRVMSRVDTDDSIPPWVDKAVNTMWWIGTALFLFGIMTFALGADARRSLGGALAAAAFGFAGMMWWGVRNGLRNHFDRKTGIQLDDLVEEARQADRELRNIQERIQRMADVGRSLGRSVQVNGDDRSSTAELVERIGECSRRITDLERLARRQERAMARRSRLKTLRERFRSAQASVTQERQEWCRLLTQLGMDETVNAEQAFDWWQKIQQLREMHTQWRNSAPEVEGLRRMFEGMRARVEQLGTRLASAKKMNFTRPLEVLTAWQQQLKSHDRDRLEKERLTQEADTRARDAIHAQHQLEAAELRRSAVLARAGVSSREELVAQQEAENKRKQLENQLNKANDELNDLASAEKELAIVEDDLIRFDPAQARETIQLLDLELTEVVEKLNNNHEELGSLKQEIKLLEASRDSHADYFQKAQLASEIYRAAEEWVALEIEQDAVVKIRRQFEQENISGTLVTASLYMHRMTSGRYHRIWAPLGEDFLCIDDEYGQTFRVEQLSGGTREQLFLSIRFALVREFARRGVELPIVMDDLFVNFDQERTEAAADCLIELAASGQQVLFFTCHEHLAKLFQTKHIEPLWLPGHKVAVDVHKPELEEFTSHARVDGGFDGVPGGPNRSGNFSVNSDDLLDDQAGAPLADEQSSPA